MMCNLDAGAELIEHNREIWNGIHSASESNVLKAKVVADRLELAKQTLYQQRMNVGRLANEFLSVPDIKNGIAHLSAVITQLQDSFTAIESKLSRLEILSHMRRTRETEAKLKHSLAMYKDGSRAALQKIKGRLANEHASRVAKHESLQKRILEDRQLACQRAFDEELRQYKMSGKINNHVLPEQKSNAIGNLPISNGSALGRLRLEDVVPEIEVECNLEEFYADSADCDVAVDAAATCSESDPDNS